jgi:hypothetical protein
MSSDEAENGPGDWSLPPVEPASPLGFESRLPSGTAHRPPVLPGSTTQTLPDPPLDVPVPARVPDVPRRNPATDPVSPMRALAGALVAVAGVLLGIGALLWATDEPAGSPTLQASQGQTLSASPAPSPLPSPEAVASTAPSAVAPVPTVGQSSPAAVSRPATAPKLALTVLNNSNRNKLADRAAQEFRAAGWPIKLTGNFTGRVSETTVYYAPGQLESAQLLARSFPQITRVRPRFDSLPGSGLTVVLTRSYDA